MSVGELLERDRELTVLDEALRDAQTGRGSIVLVHGEAGIGKTSLVRAFARRVAARARLLSGACDDLVTPRTLGPLRDAVRGSGPLAAALASGDRDAVLSALLSDLDGGDRSTVLVLEDVHWADDATLDVLRYLGRRVVDLPVVLIVTYRDDEIGPSLQRVLGCLGGGTVRRVAPDRLSRSAVARLAGGTAATSAPLFQLTHGNPFFVSEMVAAGSNGAVPSTVVDVVLARVQRLGATACAALEQLSVVPSGVELPLARVLLDDVGVLVEPERMGLVEVHPGAVAFRHELARRAVEGALPAGVRMQYNARVLAALLERPDPDLARVVHHAVAAGDADAVVAHAPAAARAAGRLGAHAQEAALQEHVLRYRELLDPAEEAALLRERTATLFHLDRMPEALAVGEESVARAEDQGEPGLAEALIALALVQWALVRPAECLASAQRAVRVLEPGGDSHQLAYALAYMAGLRGSIDNDAESQMSAEAALAMARRLDAPPLVALGEIALGTARLKRGNAGGLVDLRSGIDGAVAASAHVFAMTGWGLAVQDLWHDGRYAEAQVLIDEATAYAHERDLLVYLDHVGAYGLRLQALRGEWEAAEANLRGLLATSGTGAVRHCLPELARLLVRRGADDAPDVLERARRFAERADNRYANVPVAMARVELAWLTEQPGDALDAIAVLAARTAVPGAERARADLLRWQRRLGMPAQPFPGCPPEYAAGLRGDWRTAAQGFADLGAPYEQALELADSDEVEPMLEGLRMLDDFGARPAAAVVRRRLRRRGVAQVPRGPKPTTRANPAGLADRQVEILRMLAAGRRTNAEIAAKLVLSIRTVDHHVSAVLQKLGVTSRRQVSAAWAELGWAAATDDVGTGHPSRDPVGRRRSTA